MVSQFTENTSGAYSLTLPIEPPYIKQLNQKLNEFGLPIRDHYTTKDLCKILNISPDTLRSRFRKGYYKEPPRKNGKRVLTLQEIKVIIDKENNKLKKTMINGEVII